MRFYWHLTADGAVSWIRELSERFNTAGVAFHAKALSDPATYMRADAGVLYVDRRNIARAMDLLPDLHAAVGPQLRRTAPMFSKRLAPGLAVAEDPGDGRSFGQHRCQLVSEGLVRAFDAGTKELDGPPPPSPIASRKMACPSCGLGSTRVRQTSTTGRSRLGVATRTT